MSGPGGMIQRISIVPSYVHGTTYAPAAQGCKREVTSRARSLPPPREGVTLD